MKPLKILFVLFACSVMLFVSCKKDDASCDGKGALHYYNNSGSYVKLVLDNIDYGVIANNRAIEISQRTGTFHYYAYKQDMYGNYTLGTEGDVEIKECEGLYVSYN